MRLPDWQPFLSTFAQQRESLWTRVLHTRRLGGARRKASRRYGRSRAVQSAERGGGILMD